MAFMDLEMSKKQKFSLEFPIRCSPTILFEFIATASGLQEWFADYVDEKDGTFYFGWNGNNPEVAKVLEKENDKLIRFQWDYMDKDEYFELRIEKSELSNQTILTVVDFADKKEVKDQSQLWEYQLKELFHRIGSN
jgi:uncharacterized protein YndB with AHSA1/START domain